MMAWRLHLTNRAIQRLDIIEGEPTLLAVWSRRDRIAYYDLDSGIYRGEQVFEIPEVDDRQGERWQSFVSGLKAPNGGYLPAVNTGAVTVHTTDDGRMRLYDAGAAGLYLEDDGKEARLDTGDAIRRAVALDRFLGLSAALDQEGWLHVFQQQIKVGAFDLGLTLREELMPVVAIARGGGAIFVTDGQAVVLTDSGGQVRKRLETHYLIRQMTCSPDGGYLVTGDMDTGVVRVYHGADLALSHQRFAIDLVAEATQVQLLADMPPPSVALSTLTVADGGTLAFSMAGVICVTDLTFMDELPRPQVLL
jgi:hypothetical protein